MMKTILCIAAVFTACTVQAQKEKRSPATFDSAIFSNVKYRQIGPFRGGRSGTVHAVNTAAIHKIVFIISWFKK